MKITAHIFLFLLLISYSVFSQEFELRGTVENELGLSINGAEVENLRTMERSNTDCDGNYNLKVKLGDSIRTSHRYFLDTVVTITNYQRLYSVLQFDRKKVSETFTQVMDDRYDNPTEEKKKLLLRGRSQVTIVMDYLFEFGAVIPDPDFIKQKTDTLITLRNDFAIDLLGEWGRGGVVWLFMECEE